MIDNATLTKALDILQIKLEGKPMAHSELQEQAVQVLGFVSVRTDDESYSQTLEELVSRYESSVGVKTFDPDVIVADHASDVWFNARRDEDHPYFERYRKYLKYEGFGAEDIDNIEINCEKALSRCADPTTDLGPTISKKRGMVIGDVQAGKTANYLGLINMACDYGYRIIVLLAGMTDSLRKQTQDRVDVGFIGAYSATMSSGCTEYAGVGSSLRQYFAIPLTNSEQDFAKFIQKNHPEAATDFNKPVILVIKKNASILKSVETWLRREEHRLHGKNVLIIDDEADNASINTAKPDYNPTTVNRRIRSIYNYFPIASYVGFTATPFANIFIDPVDPSDDNLDLFPSDFIVQLNAPSTYFGGDDIFPLDDTKPLGANDGWNYRNTSRAIRRIDPNEIDFVPVKHKTDLLVHRLPDSLKEAILCFLIDNAVRTLRGQKTKHRSMMINISPLNAPQEEINLRVTEYLNKIRNVIEQDSFKSETDFLKNEDMLHLYCLYMGECESGDFYAPVREDYAWADIQHSLFDEIQQFQTTIINNRYRGDMRFDYSHHREKGARVIVIGGFVLSRGLTLEGLCVSYYSRSATAYDTLLQMCRWFGYRPRYKDLCRIYMSQSSIDSFSAVFDAVRNLKEQFREMELQGKAPRDYGLMIQQSPETLETSLLITARNKMRHTDIVERYLNYGGVYADTSKLFKDTSRNRSNLKRVDEFVATLLADGFNLQRLGSRHMFTHIPKEKVAYLLSAVNINIPTVNKKFDCESLTAYIRESDQFPEWDVVFATGESNRIAVIDGKEIPVSERSFHLGDPSENYIRIGGSNNRIIDPGIFDAGLGLSGADKAAILEAKRKNAKKAKNTLTATDLLKLRERPLLVVYYIDLKIDEDLSISDKESCVEIKEAFGNDFLLGLAIGFPAKESTVLIRYRANKVKLEESTNEDEAFEEGELQDE